MEDYRRICEDLMRQRGAASSTAGRRLLLLNARQLAVGELGDGYAGTAFVVTRFLEG